MLSLSHFGRAAARAAEPKFLRNVLAFQKRNQCKHEDDNPPPTKSYDEQDSQFTDQELNLFKKLFMKYDRDENCKLDRWEFNQFAKFLVGRSYNSIDLEKVLRRVDADRDGWVTWLELMQHFERKFRPQKKPRVAIAFNFFDKDFDGRLEYWETKQAVLYLGEDIFAKNFRHKFDSIDTDQDGKITWVFKALDRNEDGSVSWNELMRHVQGRYKESVKKSLKKHFDRFDRDRDGKLRYWETKLAFQGIGLLSGYNKDVFKMIDKDNDGCLTFEDFCDYVTTRKLHSGMIMS